MSKILVMIPSLNEGAAIGAVIKGIRHEIPSCEVLVVDGFSRDNTVEVSLSSGASVLQLAKEFGIGGAVEAGLLYAYRNSFDYFVRIDADGQHPPSQINALLNSVKNGEADFLIGSRFLGESDYDPNWLRHSTIRVLCWMLWIFHGVRITDCTSGCQIYNRAVITAFARDPLFEYSEIRAIWMAKKAGFKVKEQFINMASRETGVSSFSPSVAFFYLFKNVVDIVLSFQYTGRRRTQ